MSQLGFWFARRYRKRGVAWEDGEPHLAADFGERTEFAQEAVGTADFVPVVGVGTLFHVIECGCEGILRGRPW